MFLVIFKIILATNSANKAKLQYKGESGANGCKIREIVVI